MHYQQKKILVKKVRFFYYNKDNHLNNLKTDLIQYRF